MTRRSNCTAACFRTISSLGHAVVRSPMLGTHRSAVLAAVERSQDVKPVGSYGLPTLDVSPQQPDLLVPERFRIERLSELNPPSENPSRAVRIWLARLRAFNEIGNDGFSLSKHAVREKILNIETSWAKGEPVGRLNVLFFLACLERHHHPNDFRKRDEYLRAMVDAEVADEDSKEEGYVDVKDDAPLFSNGETGEANVFEVLPPAREIWSDEDAKLFGEPSYSQLFRDALKLVAQRL